jgi:hypothetical protein
MTLESGRCAHRRFSIATQCHSECAVPPRERSLLRSKSKSTLGGTGGAQALCAEHRPDGGSPTSAEAAEAQRKGFAAHVAAHPEIQHAIKALRATNPKPLIDERTTLRDAAPPAAMETPGAESPDESGPTESDPETEAPAAQPAPENKRSRKALIALLGLLCALPLLWLLVRDRPEPQPLTGTSAKPSVSASAANTPTEHSTAQPAVSNQPQTSAASSTATPASTTAAVETSQPQTTSPQPSKTAEPGVTATASNPKPKSSSTPQIWYP